MAECILGNSDSAPEGGGGVHCGEADVVEPIRIQW
jgi:hypothetical protein